MRGQNSISSRDPQKEVRIGVDLMGSDTNPSILLKALLAFFQQENPPYSLLLFGTEEIFSHVKPLPRISFIPAKEVITMEDDPLSSVRLKKNSSLCQGVQMLQKKEIDAFISAGNTGALIASANFTLPMLPGIDRPALLTLLPTKKKEMAVLDVGANIAFKTEHLFQYALMGIAFQRSRGIAHPTVGLLNIGTEEKKGTPELREAYQKLQDLNKDEGSPLFVGNIEGRDVFKGDIDVLITDGFTGNVFLKTSEGTAAFILAELQQHIPEGCPSAIAQTLASLRQKLHHAEYPGAILSGVDGIIVKCHGDFSPQALIKSIQEADLLVTHSFLDKIRALLQHNKK